jgi:hypothetical protein
MSASPMAVVAEGAVQAVEAAVAVMETGVDLSVGADVEFEVLVEERMLPTQEMTMAILQSSRSRPILRRNFESDPDDPNFDTQRFRGRN